MFDDFLDEDEFVEDEGGESSYVPAETSLPPPNANTEMLGHGAIEKQLLDLFNEGKLPHAMIFAGPMGVGKATMAFRLARFLFKHGKNDDQGGLFGDAPPEPTSLDVSSDDPVTQKVASGGHPDLRYFERPLTPAGIKKTVFDVETVRKIAPFLRMSSAEGGWRVVIADEADLMNKEAQNAILKILEEPPPQALLILVCDRLGTMIPTIRSRCRTFLFQALDAEPMASLLKRAAPHASSGEIKTLTELADGSIGRALELHEEESVKTLDTILAFLSEWPEWRWSGIHQLADNLWRKDAARAYAGFTHIMEWIAQGFTRGKAVNADAVPEMLKTLQLQSLSAHYSLGQWIEICEKLNAHFTAVERSNLDERQGVIGAFAIFGGQ